MWKLPWALVVFFIFVNGGCVDDDKAFIITKNLAPNDQCMANMNATDGLYQGTLDVLGQNGYYMFPLIINNMASTKEKDEQPERNILYIRSIDVELDMGEFSGDFNETDVSFSLPVAAFVEPSGGKVALSMVPVVPAYLVKRLEVPVGYHPIIIASIRATAARSGETLETAAFLFPIELCSGCLVGKIQPDCANLPEDISIPDNPCGLPQDSRALCCFDKNYPERPVCLTGAPK